MAIKIRCHQCRRKISIDDAFAGGFCRCPYCKEITRVPGRAEALGGRPERPVRPERPGAPVTSQAPADGPQVQEALPVARPVVVQGVVALIISGLLLFLVGGAAVLYYTLRGGRTDTTEPARQASRPIPAGEEQPAARPEPNPFTLKGLRVAGMEFTPPVVYVVDCSWSMIEFYDPSSAVVRYSIRSLSKEQRFNVMIVTEEGATTLTDTWAGGGEGGDAMAKAFFMAHTPAGATELKGALRRSLAAGPKSVVLLAAKAADEPADLIEQAKGKSVALFAVSLGAYPEATKDLKAMADQTGGQCREFTLQALLAGLEDLPPLP